MYLKSELNVPEPQPSASNINSDAVTSTASLAVEGAATKEVFTPTIRNVFDEIDAPPVECTIGSHSIPMKRPLNFADPTDQPCPGSSEKTKAECAKKLHLVHGVSNLTEGPTEPLLSTADATPSAKETTANIQSPVKKIKYKED